MSNTINPTGVQGASPPSTVFAAAQATAQAGSNVTPPTVATATAQAVQSAATADQATQLDLSPASGVTGNQGPPPALTMEQAAQAFQNYLQSLPSNLQFQPDQQAGLVVFKVVNPITQKVIRQLPPEDVVEQARNLRMAQSKEHSGILLDEST